MYKLKRFVKKIPIIGRLVKSLFNRYNNLYNDYISKKYKQNIPIILNELKLKAKHSKIKVCFYVVFDSSFSAYSIYEKMFTDDMFEPFIVVIPDVARGNDNMLSQLEKTYNSLNSKYNNVYMSYDYNTKSFTDYTDKIDIVCFANPYDNMTYKYYNSIHLINNNKLYFFINYAYSGRTKYDITFFRMSFIQNAWKYFIESNGCYNEIIKANPKLKSIEITGYSKMDKIANIKQVKRDRKKIIIAPHHTVTEWKGGLNLSNFLRFADLFLELPKMYPNIDFVFRPHPLLFVNLTNNVWGKDKVEKYLTKLTSNSNVTYDTSDDYFDTFINSDGLINDCGSFLAEYFYTDNPQCYMLTANTYNDEFLDYGKQMLDNCYQAFTKEDIIKFIDDIVINGNDKIKQQRKKYANEHIKYNFPNATNMIIESIKNSILQ